MHLWPPCGSLPSTAFSLLGPAPTLSPSFWLAQAIFKPNLFPYKYPNILNPSYSSNLPAYEDGTKCSETLAYKIQTLRNYPEESTQVLKILIVYIPQTVFNWKYCCFEPEKSFNYREVTDFGSFVWHVNLINSSTLLCCQALHAKQQNQQKVIPHVFIWGKPPTCKQNLINTATHEASTGMRFIHIMNTGQ